jgi:hypothetical protein
MIEFILSRDCQLNELKEKVCIILYDKNYTKTTKEEQKEIIRKINEEINKNK